MLPGADSIGKAAPLLLVLLRLIQGIAVGGEWSGSVLLSMEWGDQKRRGFWASMPQLGVAFGLILGTGLLYLVSSVLTDDQFTLVGLADPVPLQHRAGRASVSRSGCRSWRRRCSPSGCKEKNVARLPSIEVLEATTGSRSC